MPSKRPLHVKWTDERNVRLKQMLSDGVSALRAAAAFKMSTASVRGQARKLGHPFPSIREEKKKLPDASVNEWRLLD